MDRMCKVGLPPDQPLDWHHRARPLSDWMFILVLSKKNVIGIYLQKAQLKKKKRQIGSPISMNNQMIGKKESETSGFKNIPDNLVIHSRSVGF